MARQKDEQKKEPNVVVRIIAWVTAIIVALASLLAAFGKLEDSWNKVKCSIISCSVPAPPTPPPPSPPPCVSLDGDWYRYFPDTNKIWQVAKLKQYDCTFRGTMDTRDGTVDYHHRIDGTWNMGRYDVTVDRQVVQNNCHAKSKQTYDLYFTNGKLSGYKVTTDKVEANDCQLTMKDDPLGTFERERKP